MILFAVFYSEIFIDRSSFILLRTPQMLAVSLQHIL